MSIESDFTRHFARELASVDQRLQLFKDYYQSLDGEKRAAFVRWVMQVSQPIPDGLEGVVQMTSDIGGEEDKWVEAHFGVYVQGKKERIEPQVLRQAVQAWERGEDFTPPPGWNLFQ